MKNTASDTASDPAVQEILEALGPYGAAHPQAVIEVGRRNAVSIWIRIVDPDFRGLDRIVREERVWPLVDTLPDEVQADISLLLLLTPEEAERSPEDYGSTTSINPVLEATLDYLRQGKHLAAIVPERYGETERRVAFRFDDDSQDVRTIKGDHPAFMKWWKQTGDYLRQVADAFGDPPGA